MREASKGSILIAFINIKNVVFYRFEHVILIAQRMQIYTSTTNAKLDLPITN